MLRTKFGPLGGKFHEPLDEFGASS